MPFMEKSNWVIATVSVATLIVYLAIILPQAWTGPITDVSYTAPMVGAIVAFIVANILGMIVAAATNPAEADKKDQRDREIDHLGERVGNSFVGAGFAGALLLALIEADYFWIANCLFLAGIAGGFLSAVSKIAAYHGPFQRW